MVITGASSGIGRELAIEYARLGANVVCCARRLERLEQLVGQCTDFKGKVLAIKCDVTSFSEVSAMISTVLAKFNKIDVIVGNAGTSLIGNIGNLDLDDYIRQFDTNVFGVLRLIKAALPELKKSYGSIVLLGSISGEIALPSATAYSMTKHSVHALAKALKDELVSEKISVTLAIPGYVNTEIRRRDTNGQFCDSKNDPIPSWQLQSSCLVAKKIIAGVHQKKHLVVIGIVTKVAIWINRYLPFVLRRLRKVEII